MNEDEIRAMLAYFPGARRAARGVLLPHEQGELYVTNLRYRDPSFSQNERYLTAYCTTNEILRLRDLRTPHDHLLRIRAEALLKSTRFGRVMETRRDTFENAGRVWSLAHYYDTLSGPIKRYKHRLSRKERKAIAGLPIGFAPVVEVNAVCARTLAGDLILISESLRYLYYFMTLCLYGYEFNIPLPDRVDAGIIALRLLTRSEALDFDVDPRGTLDVRAERAIQARVDAMLQFTVGHELAHRWLGHLSADIPSSTSTETLRAYSHANEFAADARALSAVSNREARNELATAGCDVFFYLHLIELLSQDHPELPTFSISQTHPPPIERFHRIVPALQQPPDFDIQRAAQHAREVIGERIAATTRQNLLTFYGSIYLHGLGGRERRDRIDY